jgi:hypothetical protein
MFGKRDKPKVDGKLRCSWCEDEIPEDIECFGIGAKASPGVDIKALEGKVVDLFLKRRNRTVAMMIPTIDSPAKREGKDMLFVMCSESCSEALRQAVDREIELVD